MIYLNINKVVFAKHSENANAKAIEDSGNDGKEDLTFDNLEMYYDELSFDADKNQISIAGQLKIGNDEFAYLSYDIDLDFEIVISIIEAYRKKLGKLKTVLEATK